MNLIVFNVRPSPSFSSPEDNVTHVSSSRRQFIPTRSLPLIPSTRLLPIAAWRALFLVQTYWHSRQQVEVGVGVQHEEKGDLTWSHTRSAIEAEFVTRACIRHRYFRFGKEEVILQFCAEDGGA